MSVPVVALISRLEAPLLAPPTPSSMPSYHLRPLQAAIDLEQNLALFDGHFRELHQIAQASRRAKLGGGLFPLFLVEGAIGGKRRRAFWSGEVAASP